MIVPRREIPFNSCISLLFLMTLCIVAENVWNKNRKEVWVLQKFYQHLD